MINKTKRHILNNIGLFKSVGQYSSISVLNGAFNFLFISYFARSLPLDEMGIIGLVLAITYVTVPAAKFGTTELVGINAINLPMRKFISFLNDLNVFALYIIPLLIGIAMGAALYFKQGFWYIFIILLFSIVRNYIDLSDKIYIAKRKIKLYTIEKLRTGILTLVFGIILLFFYKSWFCYFIAIILAEFISVIVRYKKSFRFIKFENNWSVFIGFIKYGYPFMVGLGGAWLLNQFDKVIIERYFAPDVLGGYALAYQIGIIVRTFNTAIINAVYPDLYESFKKGSYFKIQLKYFYIFFLVSLMIMTIIIIFTKYFFVPIYGEKYAPYSIIVIIIIVSFLFEGMYKVWDSLIIYKRKNIAKTIILYISAFIGVGTSISFIPIYGMIAPAIGVTIAYVCLFIFSLLYSLNLAKA